MPMVRFVRNHLSAIVTFTVLSTVALCSFFQLLMPGDAVFLAVVVMVIATAQRLLAHEGKDVAAAFKAALFGARATGARATGDRATSEPRHAYRSYLISGALALIVIANATMMTAVNAL